MKTSVHLVRFATIGTLNYLITMLVIWIVMSYFSFKENYIIANIIAYLIAQTHNFIWSKYWIFPSSNPQNSLGQQIMLFCTAFGIAYGINISSDPFYKSPIHKSSHYMGRASAPNTDRSVRRTMPEPLKQDSLPV